MGADPNFYAAGVTPIGYAAYTLNINALKLLHSYGGDIYLRLTEQYTKDINVMGSTLLHRLSSRVLNIEAKEKVLTYVFENMTDPFEKTFLGKTAEDVAIDGETKHILGYLRTQRELKEMTKIVKKDHLRLKDKIRI